MAMTSLHPSTFHFLSPSTVGPYNVLYVSTDGFATVNGKIVNFVNQCLPFADQPQGLLSPLWVNLWSPIRIDRRS
jgi:hypothetical protein